VDLEPFVAEVDPLRCTWCEKCTEACPYGAIERVSADGRQVARVIPSLCKGGGACVPVCPDDAIALKGYTDEQVLAMLDASLKEVV
jgi:heterodisulfide reductase subunit A